MTRRRRQLRFVEPAPAPVYTGPESLAGFLFKEYAGCDSERLGAVLLDRDGRVIGTEHILNPELDDRWYTPRLLAAIAGDACTMVPFSYKPSRFAEGDPRDAARYLPFCAGTIVGSGVLLLHVAEAHDLHARYFSLLALALCGAKDLVQAVEAVALAVFHADHGTGRAEVRAGCLEAEAAVASAENRRDRAWELLEDATGLLADHHQADRRSETLMYLGTAMLAYNPANRIQGSGIYKEALAILDRIEPGTNPRLRLHLIHQLVPVLLEIDLEHRLTGTGRVAALREAEEYLRGSEALYRSHGTPLIKAERSGYLGLISLDSDYARAMAWLREAITGFCELDAVDAAVNLTMRLTVFGAVDRPPDDPGHAYARLCYDVWQFPEQRRFFLRVQERLHELLVTNLAGTEPSERLQQLRISLGEIKAQQAGLVS